MQPDQHKPSVGEATAHRLAASCLAVLQVPVRSAILHGSLTTGDFLPGRSDIDLLIVVDGRLSDAELDALEAVVRGADLGPAKGIDLDVVLAEVAAAPPFPPPLEFFAGRYDGSTLELDLKRRVSGVPDLIPELSIARDNGVSLSGAAPRDVLGPVPREWMMERALRWVDFWLNAPDDHEHAAFMVLTACRMWRFAEEGTHSSKTEAARWVLDRDPSLTAVAEALHQRTVDPTAQVSELEISRALEMAYVQLRRLR